MHAILPVLSITLLSSGGLRSAKANGTGSVSAMRVCPKAGVVQVVRKSISADFDDEPNKVILCAEREEGEEGSTTFALCGVAVAEEARGVVRRRHGREA